VDQRRQRAVARRRGHRLSVGAASSASAAPNTGTTTGSANRFDRSAAILDRALLRLVNAAIDLDELRRSLERLRREPATQV